MRLAGLVALLALLAVLASCAGCDEQHGLGSTFCFDT